MHFFCKLSPFSLVLYSRAIPLSVIVTAKYSRVGVGVVHVFLPSTACRDQPAQAVKLPSRALRYIVDASLSRPCQLWAFVYLSPYCWLLLAQPYSRKEEKCTIISCARQMCTMDELYHCAWLLLRVKIPYEVFFQPIMPPGAYACYVLASFSASATRSNFQPAFVCVLTFIWIMVRFADDHLKVFKEVPHFYSLFKRNLTRS